MEQIWQRGEALLLEKLTFWFDSAVKMLPNAVVALVFLLMFALLARLVRRVASSVLTRVTVHTAVADVAGTLIFWLVLGAGVFLALSALQLDRTVTSLLAGAGVVGLALSFAFQDLATNFVSGLFITIQQPLKVNDLVKTGGYVGVVQRIGLRSITILDLDGQHVVVPSKDIFQTALTNYSTMSERRVSLEVGVDYASDLESVGALMKDTVRALSCANQRPVDVYWTGFGGSSIDGVVRFWIDSSGQAEHDRARGEALVAIDRAFRAHGVNIPFPVRTLALSTEDRARIDEAVAGRAS